MPLLIQKNKLYLLRVPAKLIFFVDDLNVEKCLKVLIIMLAIEMGF